MLCTDSPSIYSTLEQGSTNFVRLVGLRDDTLSTPTYPVTATVTATIVDVPAGANIAGAVGIPMILDATTSGEDTEYRGVVPATAALVRGTYVTVIVTAIVSLTTKIFTKKILVS